MTFGARRRGTGPIHPKRLSQSQLRIRQFRLIHFPFLLGAPVRILGPVIIGLKQSKIEPPCVSYMSTVPSWLEPPLEKFWGPKFCVFRDCPGRVSDRKRITEDEWHHLDESKPRNQWLVNIVPLQGDINNQIERSHHNKNVPANLRMDSLKEKTRSHMWVGNRRSAYGCWKVGAWFYQNRSSEETGLEVRSERAHV